MKRGLPASPLDIPMSRTDIADYFGLTTDTVSVFSRNLRRAKLIAVARRGVMEMPDLEGLRALALRDAPSRAGSSLKRPLE